MTSEGDLDAADWVRAALRWCDHIDALPGIAETQIRHQLKKALAVMEANSGVLTYQIGERPTA